MNDDQNKQGRGAGAPWYAGDGLTTVSGRFRRPELERAFQRGNMGATRQFLFVLAAIAVFGAAASGYAAWVSLPPGSDALVFGNAWRGLLAAAALCVLLICRRARRPWVLYACNAAVLCIGYTAIALRSSAAPGDPIAEVTLFHVTQNGLTLLLIVSLAQLTLVPGWFSINALISALALAGYVFVVHNAPGAGSQQIDVTLVGIVGFLFILGMGASAQRLRRNSFFARAQLQQANLRLNQLATQDHLTECANRRHFYALAEAELARSRRYQRTMSLVILDADHFKAINDNYGHAAGDRVLQALADVIVSGLRELDTLGRIGGEEFALLLPETGLEGARQIAERLRGAIEQLRVEHEGRALGVTASFGVTERRADDSGMDALMRRADFALYEAKAAGRNRVAIDRTGKSPSVVGA